MKKQTAERITPPVAHHGEGPYWDVERNRLLSMDVLAGEVVALGDAGAISRHKIPSRISTVIRRRESGGFVIATEHGLLAAGEDLSTFEPIVPIIDDPSFRTNDGGCDPLGGFVVGTMAYDERSGGAAVYRVAPNHEVTKLHSPVSISNGVQWSADGSRAFYIDTPTKRVDVFDVDPSSGTWRNGQMFIDLSGVAGYPDGMAIDEEGGLWIAMWSAGSVVHFDATGKMVMSICVPGVSQPSSCAFGGRELNMLYITSSRQGLKEGDEPSAGSIFSLETASRGAIASTFGG